MSENFHDYKNFDQNLRIVAWTSDIKDTKYKFDFVKDIQIFEQLSGEDFRRINETTSHPLDLVYYDIEPWFTKEAWDAFLQMNSSWKIGI